MVTYLDTSPPGVSSQLGPQSSPQDALNVELDDYFHRLTTLNSLPPFEVFQTISAISARASEIRHQLIRFEDRKSAALRIKHVDPLLEELDRQFKIHSRLTAVRHFEYEMDGKGQV